MGVYASTAKAAKLHDFVSDEQAAAVEKQVPGFFSPCTDIKLLKMQHLIPSDREKFVALQTNLALLNALLLTVAAAGVVMENPDQSKFLEGDAAVGPHLFHNHPNNIYDTEGNMTFHFQPAEAGLNGLGVTFCYSFFSFLVSTLVSIVFIMIAQNFGCEPEFQHWFALVGKHTSNTPILFMNFGCWFLFISIIEHMTLQYSPQYTGSCILLCGITLITPLQHVFKVAGWAALVAQKTTDVLSDHLQGHLDAEGIREELQRYFEQEANSDPNMIDKTNFMNRYANIQSDFVLKLAEKIYDDFEDGLLDKAMGAVTAGEDKQDKWDV